MANNPDSYEYRSYLKHKGSNQTFYISRLFENTPYDIRKKLTPLVRILFQ